MHDVGVGQQQIVRRLWRSHGGIDTLMQRPQLAGPARRHATARDQIEGAARPRPAAARRATARCRRRCRRRPGRSRTRRDSPAAPAIRCSPRCNRPRCGPGSPRSRSASAAAPLRRHRRVPGTTRSRRGRTADTPRWPEPPLQSRQGACRFRSQRFRQFNGCNRQICRNRPSAIVPIKRRGGAGDLQSAGLNGASPWYHELFQLWPASMTIWCARHASEVPMVYSRNLLP